MDIYLKFFNKPVEHLDDVCLENTTDNWRSYGRISNHRSITVRLTDEKQLGMAEKEPRLAPGQASAPVTSPPVAMTTPSFAAFDPTSELWKDYWARFQICMEANSIPTERQPKVFLTNQSKATFKLISTLAAQMATPKEIENLTMEEIVAFMDEQYDSRKFIVQERFRFWSQMQRKPGETVPELAARIRQDAAKCDFDAIKDPQDEAMRTRFICSIGNEAVLKAIFKVSDEELTFSKAVKIAQDTEDAAKATKEQCYGSGQNRY